MKKYEIKITETLSRVVTIEAESERDAEQLVQDMYDDEEIVLDWNDYDGVEIEVINDENE